MAGRIVKADCEKTLQRKGCTDMTNDDIQHGIVVIAEALGRLDNHTRDELLRIVARIQTELCVIADHMIARSHVSDYEHNDPSYEMTDQDYLNNMHDVIEWDLEAARDSAINGESSEERHRHILAALDNLKKLTDKSPYVPPKYDPNLPF
jgi:hypothetical protein